MTTTVFTARTIHTLNPSNPDATAVAVRDGRVLAAGTLEECLSWDADAVVDDRFADKVLVPGFVEAHGHTADGMVALLPYVGYYPFPLPDGTMAPACRSYDELIGRLQELDRTLPPGEPIIANSFDPIYFPDQERLSKKHLDQVSGTRQVFVRHASGHLATVNSKLLADEGITGAATTPGVAMGDDGEPTGELQEAPAMNLAVDVQKRLWALNADPRLVQIHGDMCRNAGITTSTELVGAFMLMPDLIDVWHGIVDAEDFPARMVMYNVPVMPGTTGDYDALAQTALALRDRDTDKLRNQGIKLVIDGSIQGWTAVMQWPGYYTGEDQGLLLMSPEDLSAAVTAFTRARQEESLRRLMRWQETFKEVFLVNAAGQETAKLTSLDNRFSSGGSLLSRKNRPEFAVPAHQGRAPRSATRSRQAPRWPARA